MKKISLFSIVAGLFLAGCGENLPKEITSHENFKSCQQVEKNLLTIQSKFEKMPVETNMDFRAEFYKDCEKDFGKGVSYKDIYEQNEEFNKIKEKILKDSDPKNIYSVAHLMSEYIKAVMSLAQYNNRFDNSYLNK